MGREPRMQVPHDLPTEFVVLVGLLTVALLFVNFVFIQQGGSPLQVTRKPVDPVNLALILILTASLVLVLSMRVIMLADRRRQEERLALSALYEKRLALITDLAPIGMIILHQGVIIRANRALAEMLCYDSPEQVVSKEFATLLPPESNSAALAVLSDLSPEGVPVHQTEMNLLRRDGIMVECVFSVSVFRDPMNNELLGIVQVADLTERNKARRALAAEKERLSATLRSVRDAVIATDRNMGVTLVNEVAEKIIGISEQEVEGRTLELALSKLDTQARHSLVSTAESAIRTGRAVDFSMAIRSEPDQHDRFIEGSASPIGQEGVETLGAVIVFRDATERKNAEREIIYLSFHDKLTDLYNRAYMENEIERIDNERWLPLSFILGDLNGLKLVNDAFGHRSGDEMLRAVADVLRSSCRKEDIVARWGGDEFAILLPRTENHVALEVCRRIRERCSRSEPKPVRLSMALGVATKTDPSTPMSSLLKEAEDLMYRNKLTESRSARSAIIASLERTLSEKTHETSEHCERMRKLSGLVGMRFGLTASQMDELSLLAVLHDIGKVGVPESILAKPGPLNEDEWKAMKSHPAIGYRIAAATYELAHVAEGILCHHERWDGAGYPRGVRDKEIPLTARIIAVVDAYDVMVNGRPYSGSRSHAEALAELKRCAGTQFDPEIVDVFTQVVNEMDAE